MAKVVTAKVSSIKPNTLLRRLLRILLTLLPVLLLYWIFAVKIPSQVSYAEVWATIASLTVTQNTVLLLAGICTILSYGLTSTTVLPGLTYWKGTQAAVTGQVTSVVLPAPFDLVIRFRMYKSFGFSIDKSAVAVGVAGMARYLTVVVMPLLGLYALILGGQSNNKIWIAACGISALVLFALWALRQILSSKKSAAKIGGYMQAIANRALRLIRRDPKVTIKTTIVDFGSRTRDVAVEHFKSIALSNILWGFTCYMVLFLAVRFCGIGSETFSAAAILLITGVMLFLNAFPVTPGGVGVTETILVALIPFPDTKTQVAFLSALFLYRVYSWLLPMPIGAVAYFRWHQTYKKDRRSV